MTYKKINVYILEPKQEIHKSEGSDYSPKFNVFTFSF